jgi:hypothetical protein
MKSILTTNRLKFLQSNSLFIFLGFLTVLPLVLLSFFNNPGSDDFDYSFESQTEPFFALQIRRYFDWSGRYFSNGLISLDPLTYNNYYGFKVIPIFLLALFAFALYYFVTSLKITSTLKEKFSFVGLFAFLYIAQMPDICEGFYWIPGSLTNQLPISLALLFFGSFIRYYQNKNKFFIFLSIVLLAAILGCNEISVVLFLIIMSFLVLYNLFILRKPSTVLLLLFVATIVFSSIELLAPGNSARATHIAIKHQFVFSVFKSLQLTFGFIFNWLPLVLLSVFFFLEKIIKGLETNKNQNLLIHPVLSFGMLFIMVFFGIFPAMWSLNGPPPDRALNTIYFFYLFMVFYTVVSFLKFQLQKKPTVFNNISGLRIWFGILIFINFLSNESIVTAYRDLFSGKAYKYDAEMKNRFKMINACKEKVCIVPPLLNKPKTIFNEVDFSLTTDKNNWKNIEVSRYFRKEVIISKPKDTIYSE